MADGRGEQNHSYVLTGGRNDHHTRVQPAPRALLPDRQACLGPARRRRPGESGNDLGCRQTRRRQAERHHREDEKHRPGDQAGQKHRYRRKQQVRRAGSGSGHRGPGPGERKGGIRSQPGCFGPLRRGVDRRDQSHFMGERKEPSGDSATPEWPPIRPSWKRTGFPVPDFPQKPESPK